MTVLPPRQRMTPPLILITNDDGYAAAGIQTLAAAVAQLGEVIIVAPDGPRSGAACGISSYTPVSYRRVQPGIFACSGTPVDCVKLACEHIVPRRPDLILSGINHGDNASISVHYSGTMGAVLEGCMKGIPSIGLSLYLRRGETYDQHPVPADTLSAIGRLCGNVLAAGLPCDVCLNINIPQSDHFGGWQVARQARGQWSAEWQATPDPHAFTLTGTFTDLEPEASDTDFAALRAGRCSIVPVSVDMTAHAAMPQITTLLQTEQ